MEDKHLTAELVSLWLDREVTDRDVLKLVLPHVVADCPTCGLAWQDGTRGRIPGVGLFAALHHELAGEAANAEEAIRKTIAKISAMRDTVLGSASKEALEERYRELLELPEDRALDAIRRSRSKYVHPQLAKLLLDRGKKGYDCSPERMRELALRGEAVAVRAGELRKSWRPFAMDLQAQAASLTGNALRLRGEYGAARKAFERARTILDEGSGDPVAFAEIALMEASLLFDQYQLTGALRQATTAARIYSRTGEEHAAGRALVKVALIQAEAGDPGKAVASTRDALKKLDFRQEPELEVLVYENLALFLAEAGDPQRALEILADRPRDLHRSRRSLLKRDWIEARIEAALGKSMAAAATLANLREDLARASDLPNAAAVTLELATTFAEKGHLSEVQELTREALPLLQLLAVPQEIWAALCLLRQATQGEPEAADSD